MNKSTIQKYERIGAILAQVALQKKISPLERMLIDDLLMNSAFSASLVLLKILKSSDDALSILEIAGQMQIHEESATAMLRSLAKGGFEFEESQQNLDEGGRIKLFDWNPKESALTYLLETTKL